MDAAMILEANMVSIDEALRSLGEDMVISDLKTKVEIVARDTNMILMDERVSIDESILVDEPTFTSPKNKTMELNDQIMIPKHDIIRRMYEISG
ncbi:unnamed protein product [Cercopithifilaria johnstoni]|uniref:Uncharacterized protein n=1 Tax=Cercopithifilaria johnstoni TaxID=2874296 RepID=A0A8J2MB35_9BILA|nr:unnamed protein product [Cercopithifilaria johnstoni]